MFDKYKYNLERQYNLVFNISKSGLFIVLKVFYLWYKLQNRSKKVNVINCTQIVTLRVSKYGYKIVIVKR